MVVTGMKIKLTKNYFAIVDVADFLAVNQFKWSASEHKHRKSGTVDRVYAMRMVNGKSIMMHAFILGEFANDIDHRDSNCLNNRRSNLREATRAQNNANQRKRRGTSSRYKGVFFHAQTGKWCAQICISGQKKHLGLFAAEIEAAAAYNKSLSGAFGEYARLNIL